MPSLHDYIEANVLIADTLAHNEYVIPQSKSELPDIPRDGTTALGALDS